MKDKILEILKAKVKQESYNYWAHEEPHFGLKISEQSLIDATDEIVNFISVNNCVSGSLPCELSTQNDIDCDCPDCKSRQ